LWTEKPERCQERTRRVRYIFEQTSALEEADHLVPEELLGGGRMPVALALALATLTS
jgi:hypothetical protein